MVEPPALRAAERAETFALLVQDEQRYERRPRLAGKMKRRVVGQPQIVTEPDDDGLLVFSRLVDMGRFSE